MEIKNKIKKFIGDNKLDLSGSGSELNAELTVVCGYACYLGEKDADKLLEVLGFKASSKEAEELNRVMNYAVNNNYEKFWEKDETKKIYAY